MNETLGSGGRGTEMGEKRDVYLINHRWCVSKDTVPELYSTSRILTNYSFFYLSKFKIIDLVLLRKGLPIQTALALLEGPLSP